MARTDIILTYPTPAERLQGVHTSTRAAVKARLDGRIAEAMEAEAVVDRIISYPDCEQERTELEEAAGCAESEALS